MSRCLRDDRLWLLSEGEGTAAERAHLAGCSSCTERYQQLARDLKVIGRILQEPPPLLAIPQPRRLPVVRWVVAAAAVTVALMFVWERGGRWKLFPPVLPPISSTARQDEDVVRVLAEEVTLAFFSTTDIGVGKLPARATSLAYLQAALDGGWPSEPCEPSRTPGCEPDPFSVLFEEHGR